MLPYIVLIFLQISAALFFGPIAERYVSFDQYEIFFTGAVFGIILWLVGQIGSEVLKAVAKPGTKHLTAALVGGLIGAALVFFFPWLLSYLPAKLQIKAAYVPLLGAMIGYYTQK